ncbi:MAG: hypothetical protein ABI977_05630 [Acidobacteriota bacterium]
MIRPLRRQHRVMVVLLTVALIALFIAGLCVRPDPPPPNQFRPPASEKLR